MAKAEISKHFIFASLYLATWGKEDSRAHLFRAKMRHLAHTWLKIKLWWEASALCVSGKTIFCLKYATSQELLSCDYKSPVQSLCQCPTSRTTPTQCWPQFVPPFHKVWAQIFQKLFNSFLDSWSRMVLLKLSYLRIKRQTEGVSQYRERGRDRGRSFPRVAQELLEELGLTTSPGCPMDGKMHFQRGTGNQAATDHPQSGSRSEIYSSPSSQELQSQRTSKAYKHWVSIPCPPDSTRQSRGELIRSRSFTTKITPLKS